MAHILLTISTHTTFYKVFEIALYCGSGLLLLLYSNALFFLSMQIHELTAKLHVRVTMEHGCVRIIGPPFDDSVGLIYTDSKDIIPFLNKAFGRS